MEFEAEYWFSRPRSGDVLVIQTSGNYCNWAEVRDSDLPPTLSGRLQSPPLWINLSKQRTEILRRPNNSKLDRELTNLLRQLILVFYPGQTWEGLCGEERVQRQRARGLVLSVLLVVGSLAWISYEEYQKEILHKAVATQALKGQQAATLDAQQKTKIAELQTKLAQEEEANRKQAGSPLTGKVGTGT